ncbi:MAG: Peptidoglycan-binding domain 1 protein, partial [Parcubacteria group bacterium GW2011_GWC1_36_9]
PTSITGCDNRTTGFSVTTGQSCVGNIPTNSSNTSGPSAYNFGAVTLRNGSRGEAVKELQRFLNARLNLGLVIDGKLGLKTIAVIKQWQRDNGLAPDGLVGARTKARMNGE